MKFSHLIRRIADASAHETLFRLNRKAKMVFDCHCKPRSKSPPKIKDIIRFNDCRDHLTPSTYREYWNQKKTFYFLTDDRNAIYAFLHNTYSQKIDLLLHKANAICKLEIPFFNKKFTYSGAIDWNRDPVGSKTWPLHHWSKIKVVDTASGADPKFVWELNRHQFLIYTAMSFWLTRQENYAEFTISQIIDWIRKNPPDHGINWVESLEVGTRLISWIWILELLRGAEALAPERLTTIVSSMHAHAEHLHRYLSHYISPNTHLTGEALALFLFSAVYPEDSKAPQWELETSQVLDEEIIRQVGEDGVHKELSTAYHTYTLDYYFQYIILCCRQNKKNDPAVLDRLEKMCEFVLLTERPDGSVPLVGDSDGGSALPLDPDQSFSWKHILCDGALLFNRPDFKYRSPILHWHSVWLWGKPALDNFPKMLAQKSHKKCAFFKDSNYIVYRSDWTDNADYLFFDAGKMGFLSAGHSHADYLSFELSLSGKPYISDVGTLSYHNKKWRQYCRGTRSHNTVVVDHLDQATPAGSFRWNSIPGKGNGRLEICQDFTLIQGTHNAYPGIMHTRTFIVVKNQFILCFDQFRATGRHHYEFNYHFGPAVTVTIEKKSIYASRNDSTGMLMTLLMFQSPEIKIHKGCTESGRGFCFPIYGEKQQVHTASISEENTGNFSRGMLFLPSAEKHPGGVIKKKESPDGLYYSLLSGSARHHVYMHLQAHPIDVGQKFLIDCDFLIEQCHNGDGIFFFAVGVSSFRCGDSQFVSIKNKLNYILFKQKHEHIEIYFAENDQVEILQSFENIVFHGITAS